VIFSDPSDLLLQMTFFYEDFLKIWLVKKILNAGVKKMKKFSKIILKILSFLILFFLSRISVNSKFKCILALKIIIMKKNF